MKKLVMLLIMLSFSTLSNAMLPRMMIGAAGLSPVLIPAYRYRTSRTAPDLENSFAGFFEGVKEGITPLKNLKAAWREMHNPDRCFDRPDCEKAFSVGVYSGLLLYATIPYALRVMKRIK